MQISQKVNSSKNNCNQNQRTIATRTNMSKGSFNTILKQYVIEFQQTKGKKTYIGPVEALNRLQFARKYLNKDISFQHSIIFTDESRHSLEKLKKRGYYVDKREQRQQVEAMDIEGPVQNARRGRPKKSKNKKKQDKALNIWGGICSKGTISLTLFEQNMNANFYVNKCLQPKKQEIIKYYRPGQFIYQQDNNPKHMSQNASLWFTQNNYNILEWPSMSPDLNPIENVWATIKQRLRNKNIKTMTQLKQHWKKQWKKFNQEYLKHFIESMPKCLQLVIEASGYKIKY